MAARAQLRQYSHWEDKEGGIRMADTEPHSSRQKGGGRKGPAGDGGGEPGGGAAWSQVKGMVPVRPDLHETNLRAL